MKDDIKLPPLPKGDVDADTCPVMWVHTDQQMENYAREAIKADRKRRGEPVAWMTSDKRHIAFGDRLTKEEAAQHGWTPLYTAMVCDGGLAELQRG